MGQSVLSAFITGAIVGGIVFGLIYGIKSLIWKNQIPNLISKFRWLIAIIIWIVVMVIEFNLGINLERNSVGNLVNLAVILGIVEVLKKEKIRNRSEIKIVSKKGGYYEENSQVYYWRYYCYSFIKNSIFKISDI